MTRRKKPLPPCEAEIFEHGTPVAILGGVTSAAMEAWIARLRTASGERVDWHYAGGRAIVKVIGDALKVTACIADLGLPEGVQT